LAVIPGTREPTIAKIKQVDAIGTRASDVEPESLTWLWYPRLLLGKLNIIDGDPDVGKSTVTLDLAARVTTGREMPDGSPGIDGAVVILSYEDGLADTIVPRLEAAGCDLRRVIMIDRVPDKDGGTRPPVIPEDLPIIEAKIVAEQAVMLIVDPLMAALSGKVDSHRDQDSRRALTLIADTAERTGAAIVVVRHMNKSGGGNPMYRGGGSIGFIGAARSGLLIGRDPDDEERRVLARLKGNLSIAYPSLTFRMEGAEWTRKDKLISAVRVCWEGETDVDATALLRPPEADDESARDKAKKFLQTYLASGEKSAAQVEAAAEKADIAWRTVERAKKLAGARSVKTKDGWVWRLYVADLEAARARADVGGVDGLGILANTAKDANNANRAKSATVPRVPGWDELDGEEPPW